MKFYSADEIKTIKAELEAGAKVKHIARKYAKEWKRSEYSLLWKINCVKKGGTYDNPKPRRGRPVGSKNIAKQPAKVVDSKGVVLSSGFVFDFKPQRAEMHSDHVRLYF